MVKEIAVIVTEDVMRAHNKTEDMLPKLVETLGHYGKVIPLADYTKAKSDEYQATINSLTAQLDKIKEQDLTVDEIKMVKAYREGKSSVIAEYVAKADEYARQLEAVKVENEQRVAKIKQALAE